MRAKSVVDVVLGEAGGRTRMERFADMLGIASVIANRAELTGTSWDSIVSARKQFDAFNKALPPGVMAYRDLAQQAIDQIMQTGPIHNATFYATPSAAHRLPGGLKQVTQTKKGHQYFSDPKGRAIATAQGYVAPDPAKAREIGLPQKTSAVPFTRAEATAKTTTLGRHLSDVNSRLGSVAARQSLSGALSRRGPTLTSSADISRTGPTMSIGPQTSGLATTSSSLRGLSGYLSDRQGVGMNSLTGAMKGFLGGISLGPIQGDPRSPEQRTRDMVSADPFGRVSGDPIGLGRYSPTVRDAIASQEYAPDTTAAQDWGAKQALEMAANPKTDLSEVEKQGLVGDLKEGAKLSYARDETKAKKPDVFDTMLTGIDKKTPTVAPPDPTTDYTMMPDDRAQSIKEARRHIALPVDLSITPAPSVQPKRTVRTVQRTVQRQRTVRQPTQVTANNFPGGTLGGIRAQDRFSVGSGLQGINAAMSGARGATGFSRSMPGVSVTSRGPNMGTITRNDKFGTTTFRDTSGNVTGVHYDGGTASRLGSVFGGIFGGGGGSSGGGSSSSGGGGKSKGGSGRSLGASKHGPDSD